MVICVTSCVSMVQNELKFSGYLRGKWLVLISRSLVINLISSRFYQIIQRTISDYDDAVLRFGWSTEDESSIFLRNASLYIRVYVVKTQKNLKIRLTVVNICDLIFGIARPLKQTNQELLLALFTLLNNKCIIPLTIHHTEHLCHLHTYYTTRNVEIYEGSIVQLG